LVWKEDHESKDLASQVVKEGIDVWQVVTVGGLQAGGNLSYGVGELEVSGAGRRELVVLLYC